MTRTPRRTPTGTSRGSGRTARGSESGTTDTSRTGRSRRWTFSGTPPAFWSEDDIDGNDTSSNPADRMGLVSARFGALAPGELRTLDLAILFAQGEDHLDSVSDLRAVSDLAQARYDAGMLTALVEDPAPPTAVAGPPRTGERSRLGASARHLPLVARRRCDRLHPRNRHRPCLLRARCRSSRGHRADRRALRLAGSQRAAPIVWRVRPDRLGVQGAVSELGSFTVYRYAPTFTSIEVVANAAGPLATPEPGAAGSPASRRPAAADPTAAQQTNGTRWLVSTRDASDVESSGNRPVLEPTARALLGVDYEMRFTGQSVTLYESFPSPSSCGPSASTLPTTGPTTSG